MPLIVAIIVLGVFPQPILDMIKQPVTAFVGRTGAPAPARAVRAAGQRKTLEELRREGVRAFPSFPNGQQIFRPELFPGGGVQGAIPLPGMPGGPPAPVPTPAGE